ncbi:hypothetical protein T439DRAFT_354456 [Meredithblackwellia eburnea MCA 4105]
MRSALMPLAFFLLATTLATAQDFGQSGSSANAEAEITDPNNCGYWSPSVFTVKWPTSAAVCEPAHFSWTAPGKQPSSWGGMVSVKAQTGSGKTQQPVSGKITFDKTKPEGTYTPSIADSEVKDSDGNTKQIWFELFCGDITQDHSGHKGRNMLTIGNPFNLKTCP